MKQEDYSDIELLIEFMSLVSKYGRKRVENVIAILKDQQAIDQVIKMLDSSIEIFETHKVSSKKTDFKPVTEEEKNMDKIIRLLKKGFSSNRRLDEILGKYNNKLTLLKTRDEKLVAFKMYLGSIKNQDLILIYNEIEELFNQHNVTMEETNDLSKWSDIITKKSSKNSIGDKG